MRRLECREVISADGLRRAQIELCLFAAQHADDFAASDMAEVQQGRNPLLLEIDVVRHDPEHARHVRQDC